MPIQSTDKTYGTTVPSVHSPPERCHCVLRLGSTPNSKYSTARGSNKTSAKFANASLTYFLSSSDSSFPLSGRVGGHCFASSGFLSGEPGIGRAKDARRKGGSALNVFTRSVSQSAGVSGDSGPASPPPALESRRRGNSECSSCEGAGRRCVRAAMRNWTDAAAIHHAASDVGPLVSG